jgi:tRNA splicing endonuclease
MELTEEKRIAKREYLKQWRARKLVEDPQYNTRNSRKWAEKHPEHAREIERSRAVTPERRQLCRDYYAANRERLKAQQREYTALHMDDLLAYNEQRKSSPEVRARKAVYRAVKSGKIIKPAQCDDCKQDKTEKQLHGHHEDYGKPLVVLWLCTGCHGKRHRAD